MHGPPDPDRKRQLSRDRKRRQRQRDRAGRTFYRVAVFPAVLEALMLRNLDAGLSEPEAERAILDRRNTGSDLSDILADWARLYLAKRDRA